MISPDFCPVEIGAPIKIAARLLFHASIPEAELSLAGDTVTAV